MPGAAPSAATAPPPSQYSSGGFSANEFREGLVRLRGHGDHEARLARLVRRVVDASEQADAQQWQDQPQQPRDPRILHGAGRMNVAR